MDRQQIFRKKSLDKVSSPDHLTDYMRVINPGIILIIVCAAILITGFVVWNIFGYKIDNKNMAVYVSNKVGYLIIPKEDDKLITETTSIICEGVESNIIYVEASTVPVSFIYKNQYQNVSEFGLQMDEEVYFRQLTGYFTGVEDGTYMSDVQILVTD